MPSKSLSQPPPPPSQPAKPSAFRLLILSPSPPNNTTTPPLRPFLEAITGSRPSDDVASFAGYTSHPPLRLRTKYYAANVGIWCDELPLTVTLEHGNADGGKKAVATAEASGKVSSESESEPVTLSHWREQMLSSEAAEVRAVIGGIILVLPLVTSQLPNAEVLRSYVSPIETVHALREAIEGESYTRDVASVVVLQAMAPAVSKAKLDETAERLEELCLSEEGILGWDFVAWDGQLEGVATEGKDGKSAMEAAEAEDGNRGAEDERNQFGEKTGIKRVIEVLEGVDWSASPDLDGEHDGHGDYELAELDDDDDDEDADDLFSSTSKDILGNTAGLLGFDQELQREIMELKMSMLENDGDDSDEDNREGSGRGREDEDTQVEQLQVLMERVVAIREAGSEMPKPEREKFARREIGRIMREMG
ncbi:hypothetical protein AYO21_02778 [Fonsecaea monophora]|uniref:Uncharacterized protein n=1 Tax=Fonsecaea monophora TaxID=254056 RepID=A0A177FF76_9EURO|nr:hypothetical protein AYO21_02778 [Fonsecaea monophora]OAG42827.1 hypothetical protein AYO21_02778 [Fonsecaea monophora]